MKHLVRRRFLAVQESQVCIQSTDRVDFKRTEPSEAPPIETVFSTKSSMNVISSMVMYVFDICSSITACYYLYREGDVNWFVFSIIPLILSLIVVNVFSIVWYLHDLHESKFLMDHVSRGHWSLRSFFHLSLLGPVIRYLELFIYGIHSMDNTDPDQEAYKVLVLQEDRDISLLALVGSFIKSAPQTVLQLYVLLQNKRMLHLSGTEYAQEVSIVSSIATLSMALSSYHRALRRSSPDKMNMTTIGSALQFASHFCIIGCRVIALASFVTVFRYWALLLFVFVHWSLMSSWLLTQRTTFCSSKTGQRRTLAEMLFNFVVAIIYVFCFLNVKDEPTRWKYTFYYVLVWMENVALILVWFLRTDRELWFKITVLLVVLFGLSIGLFILGLYYKRFHPNKVSEITSYIKNPLNEDYTRSSEMSDPE